MKPMERDMELAAQMNINLGAYHRIVSIATLVVVIFGMMGIV